MRRRAAPARRGLRRSGRGRARSSRPAPPASRLQSATRLRARRRRSSRAASRTSRMTSGARAEHQLGRRLHRFLRDVGEHVDAAGDRQHVVQEAACRRWRRCCAASPARGRTRAASRGRRPRGRTRGGPRRCAARCPRRPRRRRAACPVTHAQLAHGREDVGEAGVAVVEDRNRRALELPAQVGLAAVDGDQIRRQRQDALDVGIEQRADRGAARRPPADSVSKLLTATTCGPAPIAKSISVSAGHERDDAAGRGPARPAAGDAVWRPREPRRRRGERRHADEASAATQGEMRISCASRAATGRTGRRSSP